MMDRHHFLLARIAVRASFATRRIRVLLDVLAMFSSAFAAAMILSLSSDTGGVGAVASMAQYAESMRRKSCSLNAFSPAKTIVDVGTSGTSFHPGTLAGLAVPLHTPPVRNQATSPNLCARRIVVAMGNAFESCSIACCLLLAVPSSFSFLQAVDCSDGCCCGNYK